MSNNDNFNGRFVLPFTAEQLETVADLFDKATFSIDYKESIKNFDNDNNKFLNYIANCNIYQVLIVNYDLDEDFSKLLIEYVKFDRELYIPVLSDVFLSILFDTYPGIKKQAFIDFIKTFKSKYRDTCIEANNFFYSINKILSNLIDPTAKELEEEIRNAKSAKMSRIGPNIVSLSHAVLFYNYIATVDEGPMRMYEEFTKPVMNGNTLVSYFIQQPGPYKVLYTYNQMILHPEIKENIQKQLDEINASNDSKEGEE